MKQPVAAGSFSENDLLKLLGQVAIQFPHDQSAGTCAITVGVKDAETGIAAIGRGDDLDWPLTSYFVPRFVWRIVYLRDNLASGIQKRDGHSSWSRAEGCARNR